MQAKTTNLYASVHAQPGAVRTLLADGEGPAAAAEKLAGTERVLLSGIGTSFHAALVGEYMLRLAGINAWAVRSFEFVSYPRQLQATDAVIVISHRGNKLYGAQAVELAKNAHLLTIGISGKNTKMQGVDMLLETVEQDPSSTHSISYISSLTRLAQIAIRLAAMLGKAEQAQRLEQGLTRIPALMEHILERENEIRQIADEAVQQQRRLYFVGAGPNAATAFEGALKAKEAAYVTAEGFELEQAIHGPLVAFETNDILIPLSVPGAGQRRMADFLQALSEINPRCWLPGEIPNEETAALFHRAGWSHFPVTDGSTLPEELTPMLTALPVQLLADFLATARGTNADSFRMDQERYKQATARLRL